MCDAGKLGEFFKGIDPTLTAIIVSIAIQTIKNSILVAAGKMSAKQMGAAFVDSIVVSGGFFAGVKIGGLIGAALGWEAPVLGYMLGSLIGASFSVVYNIGKKRLISFCVDTGFTCFGLVDQDYELPEEVLNSIGIDTIEIPRKKVDYKVIETTEVHRPIDAKEYETIDITVLRRGIIGVNKVGYEII